MIRSIDAVDFDKATAHIRKRDGLKVAAVVMADDFEIKLPDVWGEREEERNETFVREEPRKNGKTKRISEVKKVTVKQKFVVSEGGTIRGKKGDVLCRAADGFIFGVHAVDPHDRRVKIFAEQFAPESSSSVTPE